MRTCTATADDCTLCGLCHSSCRRRVSPKPSGMHGQASSHTTSSLASLHVCGHCDQAGTFETRTPLSYFRRFPARTERQVVADFLYSENSAKTSARRPTHYATSTQIRSCRRPRQSKLGRATIDHVQTEEEQLCRSIQTIEGLRALPNIC